MVSSAKGPSKFRVGKTQLAPAYIHGNLPRQHEVWPAFAAKHVFGPQIHGPGHYAKNFQTAWRFVGHARAHNVFKVCLRQFAPCNGTKGRHLEQQPLQQTKLRTALGNEKQLSAKGSYFLNLAKEQTGRMLFVATQLLDFQKVDIGKGQVFLVMVDVVKLVQRRISMFEATASKMGLTLEFKSNQTSYLTAVDELNRIFNVLIF